MIHCLLVNCSTTLNSCHLAVMINSSNACEVAAVACKPYNAVSGVRLH